jgi:DNA-binding transcriptional LysR family regulator
MNLRQLRYFCEIVAAGNASAAAARLHVAPTAVSMQLAQLEADIGGELFDRSRRPMELTALGRYLQPRAKELLASAKRIQDETREVAAGQSGTLAIGYTRSVIFSILPRAIRAFRAAHPQVKIELITMLSEHQHVHLLNGRIQIGLSRYLGEVETAGGLAITKLLDDPFVVVLPVGHALSKRKSLRAAEIAALALVTYPKDPQSHFADHTVDMLRAAGVKPNVAYEANDIHTALGMVASGLGCCLVGRSVAEGNRDDVVFVRLADIKDRAAVVAVTRSGETGTLVTSFVETLVAAVAAPARK